MTRQYPLPLPHREAMDADDFMVTSSNADAAAWINRWPDWPAHCLAVYGPSGSGKTHLAQVWQKYSGAQVITLAELTSENRLAEGNYILDGADTVAGNAGQEEALFHLYNRLRDAKSFLLLTATLAPAQWNLGLADLRSRLSSIPSVAIAAPDEELLSAMLLKQFMDRQIDLGIEVVNYLLPRIERTPEAIRNLVTKLDQVSLAEGRRITTAMARKLLEDQDFLNR